MASLRAHLASYLVRRNVRNRLGTMGDVAQIRAVFGGRGFPDPAGAAYEPGTVGGVPGEWVRPRRAAGPERRLLYLHGGGFVACSPRTHRPVTGALAERGLTVFAPDYRLAPEHPFPAAVEDACAAWSAFAAEGPGCIAGDSAGGNLALVAMLAARDRGLPMPAAAALFSPVTDFLAADGSRVTNAGRDAMFDPRALVNLGPMYLSGADAADPRVSPLNADLAGLPPLLFHVGEREILRDDAVRMAEKARAAGVTVSLEVFPVVAHVWQFAHSMLPEARRSLDGAAAFLEAHAWRPMPEDHAGAFARRDGTRHAGRPLRDQAAPCRGADREDGPMSLIGRIVTKLLGNEDRPVVRDDRNASSASPLGRLVTKILGK